MPVRQIFGSKLFVLLLIVVIGLGMANILWLSKSHLAMSDTPTFVDTEPLFASALQNGKTAFAQNQFLRAEQMFTEALHLAMARSEFEEAHLQLAFTFQATGDARSAIGHLKDALTFVDLSSADAHVIRGHLAWYQDDLVRTVAEFETALAQEPDNFYANNALGTLFLGDEVHALWDYRRALKFNEVAAQHDADSQLALRNLAQNYFALGNYTEALIYFEKTLALDASDSESRFMIGMIHLLRFEHIPEAIALLKEAARSNLEYQKVFDQIVVFQS